ncbi:MAG: 23S rRNA (uracil(1939)-C(5))-methyltransferase RlmD [Chloroflexi bacterium]|nr:23S rRNA (uracil(1939)-C(5))-methyltransferase RlmD [Chloroflexota bacterium]
MDVKIANPKSEIGNLKLTGMSYGGEAVGRDETGRVVFVPYAIAGETVRVEIVEAKKNFARGRVVEILEASPARVTPRCEHFASPPDPLSRRTASGEGEWGRGVGGEACGGCQWQHIAYDAQLKFKTEIVREQFARIGKMADAPVRDTIGMREPWRYRNHAQFVLDDAGQLCYRAFESHRLVRINECHIIHPLVHELFRAVELAGADFAGVTLRAGTQTGEKMIVLDSRDDEPPEIEIDEAASIAFQVPSGETVALIGKEKLTERLRDQVFAISPAAFFQVNTEMAEHLVTLVEKYLAPRPSETLLDAYGGVGIFGLLFAPRVARVIEIEENPRALDDVRANAASFDSAPHSERNEVESKNGRLRSGRLEFHAGRVEFILPRLDAPIDIVVADPPRAGIEPRALSALIAEKPRALAYVSCDPATLARDARRLVDGGYRLIEVQPVDMFPQTYHIECVAHFARE